MIWSTFTWKQTLGLQYYCINIQTTARYESDLIILDARGSCGCTVPEYPKNTPIAPGETREIKVKFDSANKPGNQTKTVTLTNNTERGRDILRIKTMVTAESAKEQTRQTASHQIHQ